MSILSKLFKLKSKETEVNLCEYFEQVSKEELDWLEGIEVTLATQQYGDVVGKILKNVEYCDKDGWSFVFRNNNEIVKYSSCYPKEVHPKSVFRVSKNDQKLFKTQDGRYFFHGGIGRTFKTNKKMSKEQSHLKSFLEQKVLDLTPA